MKQFGKDCFASTSSANQQTSSVGVGPQFPVSPPSSNTIGSPLFWMGIGVALSALFSWAAKSLKNYAMQQAFKTMMGQMNTQNSQFSGSPFMPGSPFPFPPPTSPPSASQPVTVDVSSTKLDDPPTVEVKEGTRDGEDDEPQKEPQKSAFVDVSPEETIKKNVFENFKDVSVTKPSKSNQESENQNASSSRSGSSQSSSSGGSKFAGKSNPLFTVEALEKMMEDPNLQKMVYPYLPEEMRNPDTFKWMLQNPLYRQQLQDMLSNMSGSGGWDASVMDSLKNFDLNSPDVKQQFDEIGITPEEVISKIMANPDVAMAFQNPRIQAAIMDVSQNPYNIGKYQSDKEVMDVFNKISELFPGVKP